MNTKLWITFFTLTLAVTNVVFAQSPNDFKIQQLQDGTIQIMGFVQEIEGKIKYGSTFAEKPGFYKNGTLEIPSHISGIPVTSIKNQAFENLFNDVGIKSIKLPNTLREIGNSAFAQSTRYLAENGKLPKFQGLVIPRSVTTIGIRAFAEVCRGEPSGPQTLVIPSSVKSIGYEAFWNWCISELYIESVFQGTGMFHGYSGSRYPLHKITFPANWPDDNLGKLDLPSGFINFYKSQGKKAGAYVLNGQLWTYAGPASSPPNPISISTSTQSKTQNTLPTVTFPQSFVGEWIQAGYRTNEVVTLTFTANTVTHSGNQIHCTLRSISGDSYTINNGYYPFTLDIKIENGNLEIKDHDGSSFSGTWYSESQRRNANVAKAYFESAVVAYNSKDYDKAIADFTQVIQLDPNSSGAYINRGNAYFVKQDYDKAIADYTRSCLSDRHQKAVTVTQGPRPTEGAYYY